MPDQSGAELARLLLGGYQSLVADTHQRLGDQGHPDHRSVHHFALRAIAHGAGSVTELGQRLDVSRQAAAKTVALLEDRGYVQRVGDPADARRKRLEVTDLGHDLLTRGEASMQASRARWAERVGARELDQLQACLAKLVASPPQDDAAGWLLRNLGQTD